MPSRKAFNLRLSWRIRHTQKRQKVISGELAGLRDVKNEDRPGYVYENTWNSDKTSVEKQRICHNWAQFCTKLHNSISKMNPECPWGSLYLRECAVTSRPNRCGRHSGLPSGGHNREGAFFCSSDHRITRSPDS